MALETQFVAIDFFGGIDTNSDPKLVPPVKLTNLENAKFNRAGLLQKRFGYQAILTPTVADGMIAKDKYLLLRNKSELQARVESLNTWAFGGYVSPCKIKTTAITGDILSNENLVSFDQGQGISVTAIGSNIAGTVFGSIIVKDEITNTVISRIASDEITTVFFNPKVYQVGSYFYIFYVNGASGISYIRSTLTAPGVFSSPSALATTTLKATRSFDAIKTPLGSILFAYSVAADNDIRIARFNALDATFGGSTWTVVDSNIARGTSPFIRVVWNNALSQAWAIYASGQVAYYFRFDNTLTLPVTEFTLLDQGSTSPLFTIRNASAGFDSNGANFRVFNSLLNQLEIASADFSTSTDTFTNNRASQLEYNTRIRIATSNTLPAGLSNSVDYWLVRGPTANTVAFQATEANRFIYTQATTTPATRVVDITSQGTGTQTITYQDFSAARLRLGGVTRSSTDSYVGYQPHGYALQLVTDVFVINNEAYYAAVRGTNELRRLVVYRMLGTDAFPGISNYVNAVPVASALLNSAALLPRELAKPSIINNVVSFVLPQAISLSAANGQIQVNTAPIKIDLDFNAVSVKQNASVQNQILIAGGMSTLYDGAFSQEQGFLIPPDSTMIGWNRFTGGSLDAGNYQVSFVYEYTDASGNTHQSAPSVPITAPALASTNIFFAVPTLTASLRNRLLKTASATNSWNPSDARIVMYATVANGLLKYRVSAQNVDVSVNQAIFILSSVNTLAPILYTDIGELENIAPPPALSMANNKNRVALIASDDPKQIWFSKFYYPGKPVQFNDSLVKRLDGYGDCVAVAAMDDKWIVWTADSTHYWSGDGPLDSGAQDTFTDLDLITTDVGCIDADSVVTTPNGLMFKSKKGYRLLTRALSIEYIGEDVDLFNEEKCFDGTLIANENEVRFLTSARCLSYNYERQQWAVWTNHSGINAGIFNGTYVYLRNTKDRIYKETPNFYKDENASYPLKIETAWIKLAGIQNFQRVRRISLLGDFKSEHILKISTGYDYENYYADSTTWDAGAILNVSVFGDGTVFGDSEVFGGQDDNIYQVQVHMARQKCQSIRFKFEDLTNPNADAAYTLSNMTLECGVKSGINKVKVEKTVG